MQNEVVRDVIDNYCPVDVSAQERQVFDKEGTVLRGVLSIESILYVLVHVNLVDDLVRIVL